MSKRRSLAGAVLLALAILCIVDSASALPSFVAGHQAGSGHHHARR
jgi:hypothetical protein